MNTKRHISGFVPVVAPAQSARSAALRHVSDDLPGIVRRRSGKGFLFVNPHGRVVRLKSTLGRIRSLAIPPAWTEVWICAIPNGHLQATGRDARGRKQYRYHTRWREVRDETKYARLTYFASALPRIRKHVRAHLALPGLTRDKVLAIIVQLLETTFIRVGNEEYERANGSFGLTTMKDRHVHTEGSRVELRFRGKSGKSHTVNVADARLARLVKRCRDVPGQQLFQYINGDDKPHPVDSGSVNEYLRVVAGDDFTAKDFRTWAGTLLAARRLSRAPVFASASRSTLLKAIDTVAADLGNTRAICRKCYIHPAVLDAFQDRDTFARWRVANARPSKTSGLRLEERALVRFLTLNRIID